MPIFLGLSLVDAYNRIIGGGSALFGLPKESGLIILFALLLVHFFTGFVVAFFSFSFAIKINLLRILSPSVADKE